MIHVDRSAVPEPPSLASSGVEERRAAIKFFRLKANRQLAFSFKAYGSADVRDALNELFHEKCAYCESSYRATAPVDVEHFRPKGAVVIGGAKKKPGYYWLAASWDNLLPSCIDCNRARTQPFAGEDDDDEIRQVGGKENKFPLSDEKLRGSRPDSERDEEKARLLLHPCIDRPESHLEFLPNGLVRPLRRSPMGTASIDVYALLRKGLKEERQARVLQLAEKMDSILYLVEELDKNPRSKTTKSRLKLELERLRRETEASRPYAGLARQLVGAFHASLRDRTCRSFVHDLMAAATTRPVRP